MRYALSAGALLLGTVAVATRDIDRLKHLYSKGTTPDTARIGGRDIATVSQPLPQGSTIDRSKWQITCSSGADRCKDIADNSTDTIWTSSASDSQNITIQLGGEHAVSGLTMVPRQDDAGEWIEEHQISVSTDGTNWEEVAYGTWWPDKAQKLSAFQPKKASWVRLSATQGSVSIADLEIYQTDFIPPNPSLGAWGPTIDLPLVPVSAAVDPISGAVVTWSSWGYDIFVNSAGGETQTATWHPTNKSVTQRDVENVHHDMFCPGISIDADGKFVVSGGTDQRRTSIFNTSTAADRWYIAAGMNIDRGYQATSTLSDGRIFTIGGSFSGGVGGDGADLGQRDVAARGKDGELYDPIQNKWIEIPNAKAGPMLTNDVRTYRQDNHGWIFAWTNATAFQAGPSKAMNWYYTGGSGDVSPAGERTGDNDAMCGNAVMFDNGKILAMGGSPDYEDQLATNYAAVISIGEPGQNATVQKTSNQMYYKRTFHSSVVLPDGSVFVNGGQEKGLPFNEAGSQYVSERFIPGSNGGKWIKQQKNSIARVYHSLSLLLRDGTVFSAGGGLCGDCAANHFDGQIYTPPYLLNADGSVKTDRPAIENVSPNEGKAGDTFEVTTTGDVDQTASLIRYGSATHTVNTDQRRVSVQLTKTGDNKYTFQLPAEAGIAQPGYYMLFVLKDGVPSHSENVRVVPE
ncbi:uncharacterized protein N7484_000368 [Penicillium longicatenatum]|uniref:uncharacterized protein n=1 Tax=Penicillium longicatenatum TaxID=1561947 RepID=UPI0025489B53|nr:uncharacterized protein N7484_000368 [Penicillium longicatenatum]KAJ5660996.1 hypothetical protein N7484_000368 [Penicillium longicatenatum]